MGCPCTLCSGCRRGTRLLGTADVLRQCLLRRCRVRVIDTFGTEPAYNHEEYATLRGYRTNWGYWNLQPAQFMTMFRKWGPARVVLRPARVVLGL